jgi:2-oxo-4-hydroxy-4-carboxy--5-ureidoimidazoline (OHCU) decarboxylase
MRAHEMTPDQLHKAAHKMEAIGGGFAAAIAAAYFHADGDNKQRLIRAFPELFARYAPTTTEETEHE